MDQGSTVARRAAIGTFGLGLCLGATAAMANVPMYLFVSLAKISAWPVLAVVVLVEGAALQWIFRFGWRVSIVNAFLANLFSLAVGVILHPLILAAFVPLLAEAFLELEAGHISWTLALYLLVIAVLDTALELPLIKYLRSVPLSAKAWGAFFFANVIGVAAIGATLFSQVFGLQTELPDAEVVAFEAHYAPELAFMDDIYDQLEAVYDEHQTLYGSDWAAEVAAQAAEYRFLKLSVSNVTALTLHQAHALHSTASLPGDGVHLDEDGKLWRTSEQDGLWFYVYQRPAATRQHVPGVRAWFLPPP